MEVSYEQMKQFAVTNRIGPYEKEYFRKDGSRWWFVFAGASLGDGTIVEFCIDVNARKKAEQALRESQARFAISLHAFMTRGELTPTITMNLFRASNVVYSPDLVIYRSWLAKKLLSPSACSKPPSILASGQVHELVHNQIDLGYVVTRYPELKGTGVRVRASSRLLGCITAGTSFGKAADHLACPEK